MKSVTLLGKEKRRKQSRLTHKNTTQDPVTALIPTRVLVASGLFYFSCPVTPFNFFPQESIKE
jgi:hypothetical protein